MRGMWIAAAMLLIFGVLADSQPPSPIGLQPNTKSQIQAAKDTEKSQSSNEMVGPSVRSYRDSSVHQNNPVTDQNQDSKQAVDWWARSLGVLTLFVAIIQAGIYLRQAGFMKVQAALMEQQRVIMDSTLKEAQDSNAEQGRFTRDEIKRVEAREEYRDLIVKEDQKIARESAAAATRAADTLPNIERAYVFIVVTHTKTIPQQARLEPLSNVISTLITMEEPPQSSQKCLQAVPTALSLLGPLTIVERLIYLLDWLSEPGEIIRVPIECICLLMITLR